MVITRPKARWNFSSVRERARRSPSGSPAGIAAYRGDVESVDYYFTWDPDNLDVIATPTPDDAWDTSTETKTPGQYHLQLSSTGGVPGQAMKLHTVTLKCTSSPAIAWMRVDITAGGSGNVTPVGGSAYYYVNPSEATINTICTGEPLTCTEQDHCETLDGDDICPPTATQTDEGYTWEPQETTPLCEGDNVIVSRTRRGLPHGNRGFYPHRV